MSRRRGLQIADVDLLGPKVFIRIERVSLAVEEELRGAAARSRLSLSEAFGCILEASDLADLVKGIDKRGRIASGKALGLHLTPVLHEKLWNAVKVSNSKRRHDDRIGFGVAAGLILVALRGTIAEAIVEGVRKRISG